MRNTLCFAALAALAGLANAADLKPNISAKSIETRVRILSSDDFEGRAPGTPGEDKTVAYLESEFRKVGTKPGNPNGTYIQSVPLIGITSDLELKFTAGGKEMTFQPITEYTAQSRRLKPQVELKDNDIVFVGYGIVAPEYKWDDYKGVDVRGKTVVMLVNDPPIIDPATGQLDDRMFKGKAMTYYGRWMYKYEIASAKGAAACLIVHETGPAGYPFAVLGGEWKRESFDLVRPDRNESRVAFEGWLTLDAATRLFAAAGQDYQKLKAAAVRPDFRPVMLNAKATFMAKNTYREVASRNVVALVEGSDPRLKTEYVIYSAHWDHLGRDPRLKGDQIFNGALDNATGTSVLLELAKAFASLPAASRPKRSILFLSVTAEEKGLLGARYYTENPLYPLGETVANLNMDGGQNFGPSRDIEIVGYGNSTLDDVAGKALARAGRTLTPDTEPEKGYFYRSDHFEFAKQGVPALYTHRGKDIIGQPPGYGKERSDEYTNVDYHKVTDEIKPWWNFEGSATDTRFYFDVGLDVANAPTWPEWRPGNEFKAKRDAMLGTRQP